MPTPTIDNTEPTDRPTGLRVTPESRSASGTENPPPRTVSDKQAVQWGMQLQQQGHLVQAENIYRQVLAQQPRQSDALHLLGLLMHQRGRNELALDLLRRAIDTRPTFATYRSNLGVILRAMGDKPGALRAHSAAIRLAPDSAELHSNLCVLHDDLGDTEQALRHGWLATALDPQYPEARNNLANVLGRNGRLFEAILQLQEALKVRPGYVDAWFNLGLSLERLGDFDQALKSYDKVLALAPEHLNARANRALIYLLRGDFLTGFAEYEWRASLGSFRARTIDSPLWDGQPIIGKTLLLVADLELGDAIMFSRYALLAAKVSGARLLAECDPGLRELFGCMGSVSQWLDRSAPLPAHDFHISWLSLPRLFKTTAQTIPAPHSYLRPPSSLASDFDLRIGPDLTVSRKLGVAWSAATPLPADENRSCPFSHFLQLLQVQDVIMVSLQKGPAAEDWQQIYAPTRMCDMGSRCRNFADMSAVIAQLDLVITADATIAQLAGSLGKAVWLLLPKRADWQWQLDRDDSPWYPSMRLFRQEHAGDWSGVFVRVVAALSKSIPKK